MSHSHLLANQVIGHACHRTMHINTSSQVVRTNNAQKKSGDLTLSLLFAHSVAAHHTDWKTGFNAPGLQSIRWNFINEFSFCYGFPTTKISLATASSCFYKGFLRRWKLFVHNEYPISIIPVGCDWESLKTEVGHWALIDDKKLRTGVELNPPDDCGHGTWSTFL